MRDFWARRRFAYHLARTRLKARHIDKFFGQLWTVLNPLLLGAVYFFVVGVIRGSLTGNAAYLAYIFAGLFAFYYTRNSLVYGATSIVGGGKMILNTTVHRATLPLSAVITAYLLYVPMLVVYAGIHLLTGGPWGMQMVVLPVIFLIHTVLNIGLAFAFGSFTVYFRDVASFLPYAIRIWLYLSPVIWSVDQLPENVRAILAINPLYPLLNAWHQVLNGGRFPDWGFVGMAAGWAVAIFIFGVVFFMLREREFAVRV